MRILVVGLNFHPEPTGIGKYTGELVAHLASQGHDVHVITTPAYYPQWKIQAGYRAWRYQKEIWRGVEVQRCPLWVPSHPGGLTRLIHLATFAFSSLFALIAQIRWKPEVVMCIVPAFMNAPFVLAFARLIGSRSWLHIQDFELDAALNLGILSRRKSISSLARSFERFVITQFDRVSTISNNMLALAVKKSGRKDGMILFPNWVDTQHIFPLMDKVNPLRTTLGLSTEQLVILYAGTMGRKQGLEQLIIAARKLQDQPNLQFVLCGEGAIRAELEVAAQGLSNVRFLPVQPFEKLNQLLNMADIHVLLQKADVADLVMPSKLSGMFASGKAVIATAHPSTELGRIVNKVGILVPPEEPSALADAIQQLSRSLEKREILGSRARTYAIQNWDAKVVFHQFGQHLQELMISSDKRVVGKFTPSLSDDIQSSISSLAME